MGEIASQTTPQPRNPSAPQPLSPRPLFLAETVASRQLVAAACDHALATGVRPGMTVAQARALVTGEPLIVDHDPDRDTTALRTLAAWAYRFSPIVALDPPGGLMLDITGCERLFHGERRLLNEVANRLEWMGITARVAIADTIGCAWAVAHHGVSTRSIVESGDEHEAITALPVAALRIEPDLVEGLQEIDCDRIGDLFALPRLELAARFGGDLTHRLDQVLGEAMEVLDPVRPRSPLRVERLFDGPTTNLEGIMLSVRDLLARLCTALERRERGARLVVLEADRFDAPPVRFEVILSRATRDPKHLWSLMQPRVEVLHMAEGLERLELRATTTEPMRHTQVGAWAGGGDDTTTPEMIRARGELIDTLVGRLGIDRILSVEPREAHQPELSFRRRRVLETKPRTHRDGDRVPVTSSQRPSILYAKPERIDVMAKVPDGPPARLRWRGAEHHVISSTGPERIAGRWWGAWWRETPASGSLAATRDYFRVQDSGGRWLWVFRELESAQWFVHGEWS